MSETCSKCGARLLACADRAFTEDEHFWLTWCPNGHGRRVRRFGDEKPDNTPEEERIRFVGHVHPDATIQLSVTLPKGRVSRLELERLASAMSHLAFGAREQERHLRGADRWIFGKDGDVMKGLWNDQTCVLQRYTAGQPRTTRPACIVCKLVLVPGEPAYKPAPKQGLGLGDVRFCAPCVEAPQVPVVPSVAAMLASVAAGKGSAR